jgi:hypothetical protein
MVLSTRALTRFGVMVFARDSIVLSAIVLWVLCWAWSCAGFGAAPVGDPRASPPEEVRSVVDQYLEQARQESPGIQDLLCFVDQEDRRLFLAFLPKPTDGRLPGGLRLFPTGRPTDFRQAGKDGWLVLLDSGRLLDLWQVEGQWRVLCPTPGVLRFAQAKLTKAETRRTLSQAEMKQVQGEAEPQLERRRARYLAVLDLKKEAKIGNLWIYYGGVPSDDPTVLRQMLPADFRKAVVLKLDAPDGLRYQVRPAAEAFVEGEPVRVTFLLENVTDRPVRLRYGPLVEVVDCSNPVSARGATILSRNYNRRPDDPYTLWHPFDPEELRIPAQQTVKIDVNLREYYDLRVAKYTISAHLSEDGAEGGAYWHGTASTDTVKFQIKTP